LAILAAAFVVGPALLIPRIGEIFPQWQVPAAALIIAGFGMSLLITAVLVISILRSGR
jgi:hypothetical protein